MTRESKILVRKHKKDLLKYFGVGTGQLASVRISHCLWTLPGCSFVDLLVAGPGTTPGAKKPKFTLLYRGSRDGFTAQVTG